MAITGRPMQIAKSRMAGTRRRPRILTDLAEVILAKRRLMQRAEAVSPTGKLTNILTPGIVSVG